METDAALSAFGALSRVTRLEAFRLLVKHEPDGLAACDLARLLSVPQNTLSAHLNVLAQANLVTSEQYGWSIIYCVQLGRLEKLLLFLLRDCCNDRPDIPCGQKIRTVDKPVGRSASELTGRVSWGDNGSQRSSTASRSPDRRGGVRVQD
jgi:ArsR family transcriptional regulator